MNDWTSIDFAVEMIMELQGCSRRAARRMLEKELKSGKIKIRDNVTNEALDAKAIDKIKWEEGIATLNPDYKSH